MPKFSQRSLVRLATCDPRLVRVMEAVVVDEDCSIEGGGRSLDEQAANILKGVSKTTDSKHIISVANPFSRAVDVVPYPVVWPNVVTKYYIHDVARFYFFAGYVIKTARLLGVRLRWGGDWNGDGNFRDQTFDDLDHFELVED